MYTANVIHFCIQNTGWFSILFYAILLSSILLYDIIFYSMLCFSIIQYIQQSYCMFVLCGIPKGLAGWKREGEKGLQFPEVPEREPTLHYHAAHIPLMREARAEQIWPFHSHLPPEEDIGAPRLITRPRTSAGFFLEMLGNISGPKSK